MKKGDLRCSQENEIEEEEVRCPREEVDRFKMLPDDVIVAILSRLTITEAARTSILSVRWRHLWTYFSGVLDFDGSLILEDLEGSIWVSKDELLNKERDRFRSWVDQVLKALHNQIVEGLRFCSDVGNASHVDGWVQLAIKKKVKKLELDLISSSSEYCVVPSLLNFTSFSCLHVLRLSYVDVSGKLLEQFLASCPFLETLAVVSSESVVSFKVSSSSPLKLKQLEIRRCFNLKTLEISAENLESFTYSGKDLSISYKHIPNLREVSFRGAWVELVYRDFFCLSNYNHSQQLQVLKLEIMGLEYNLKPPENSTLANLQHLELFYVLPPAAKDLYFCVSLMNICPSLCALTLKIGSCQDKTTAEFGMKHSYSCLKEVKIIGFSGWSGEVEFVKYMLENAPDLKKLLIDPICPVFLGHTIESEIRKTGEFDLARTRAWRMKKNVPSSVEFIIL